MKVEGFRNVFRNVCQKRPGIQKFDCKIGFLNVKIKRSLTQTNRFLNVSITLFRNVCQKRLGTEQFDCKNRVSKDKNQTFPDVNKTFLQRYENIILLPGI